MRLSLNNRIARQQEREPGEFAPVAINLAQLRTALYECVYVRESRVYASEREAKRPAGGTSVNDHHKKFSISQTETHKGYVSESETVYAEGETEPAKNY